MSFVYPIAQNHSGSSKRVKRKQSTNFSSAIKTKRKRDTFKLLFKWHSKTNDLDSYVNVAINSQNNRPTDKKVINSSIYDNINGTDKIVSPFQNVSNNISSGSHSIKSGKKLFDQKKSNKYLMQAKLNLFTNKKINKKNFGSKFDSKSIVNIKLSNKKEESIIKDDCNLKSFFITNNSTNIDFIKNKSDLFDEKIEKQSEKYMFNQKDFLIMKSYQDYSFKDYENFLIQNRHALLFKNEDYFNERSKLLTSKEKELLANFNNDSVLESQINQEQRLNIYKNELDINSASKYVLSDKNVYADECKINKSDKNSIVASNVFQNEYDKSSNEEATAKCLVVPTFREEKWLSLKDYIKGHEHGKISQIDIIANATKDSIENFNKQGNKMYHITSDIRNPEFFNAGSSNSMLDLNEVCDEKLNENITNLKSITNSIRSIGFASKDNNSKLKFNLLSEVFYYDDAVKSKLNEKISLIEKSAKIISEPNKVDETNFTLLSNKDKKTINNVVTFSSSDNSSSSYLLLVDLSKHSVSKSKSSKNKKETLNDVVYYSDTSGYFNFDVIKNQFEKGEQLNDKDSQNEQKGYLDANESLADVESMASLDLSIRELKDNKSLKMNINNNNLELITTQKETTKIKSILKQRHNVNEKIENESLEVQVSEDIGKFLQNFAANEALRTQLEPKLAEARAFQLKKFYSKEFYPEMHEDTEFLQSVRATQQKIGFSIYEENMFHSKI
ncbi:hypothetical protein QEN19_001001 [Hanseniaspora menglaensis]